MKIINENKATDEIARIKRLNKKHAKEKGWGWFVHPKGIYINTNAGNVEYNNAVFNSAIGSNSEANNGSSESGASQAVAEDLLESHLAPIPENYDIIETEEFKRAWKKQKLSDADLQKLKKELKEEPAEAPLGSCVYKFRFSPSTSNRGQSSQDRVIYVQLDRKNKCYLLTIFEKDKQSDLSPKELVYLRKIAKMLGDKDE